jgi:hypothetical protein
MQSTETWIRRVNSNQQLVKRGNWVTLTFTFGLENKFNIPTRANSTKYKLNIGFPEELKKDETQEFIIVLATKGKFAHLTKLNYLNF